MKVPASLISRSPLSYHADEPAALVKLQEEHWNPILDWAKETFGVDIVVSNSLVVPSQSPETMKKFEGILAQFSPWEMAGMLSPLCYSPHLRQLTA